MTETTDTKNTDASDPDIETSRYIAKLMDSSIKLPGTRFAIGLDGILGFIPVIGDLLTGAAGGYILLDGVKHKVPPETMGKMVANLGGDVLIGAAIPVAGDLFDVVWKANRKNLTLLEDHLGLPRTYAKGGEDMPTEERIRPQASVRRVSLGAFSIGGGDRGDGGSGETDALAVESNEAKGKTDFVRYTFVADRVQRRSQNHVRGGGGGGMIMTTGGYVSGHIQPVTINSWTTHTNEVWYRKQDGSEDFVLLDADAIPVRDGQRITLVFTASPRLNGKMALTVVRNHSMGTTKVYPVRGRAAEWSGHSLTPIARGAITWASIGATLLFAYLVGITMGEEVAQVAAFILMAFGLIVIFFYKKREDARVDRFLAEAAAFAEDG